MYEAGEEDDSLSNRPSQHDSSTTTPNDPQNYKLIPQVTKQHHTDLARRKDNERKQAQLTKGVP
jgi:hypothetical protein